MILLQGMLRLHQVVILCGVVIAQPSGMSSSSSVSESTSTTESLFDLIGTYAYNRQSQEMEQEEEGMFPPFGIVEHYALSWSLVMTFSNHQHMPMTKTSEKLHVHVPSLPVENLLNEYLYWDHGSRSRFQFRLRLSCPLATRLVMGLVDQQGRKYTSTQSKSQANLDSDSIACGPPIDMSRNVLVCRGIPSTENNRNRFNHSSYQFVFHTSFQVTCLAYSYNINHPDINIPSLGLSMSTPKQKIRAKTNLVFTESFFATKITNLTQFLDPAAAVQSTQRQQQKQQPSELTYWNGETQTLHQSRQKTHSLTFTDSSDFQCQHNANCPTIQHTQGQGSAVCSRHITCYYSAPYNDGRCTSTVESMSLSSVVNTQVHRNRNLQVPVQQHQQDKQKHDDYPVTALTGSRFNTTATTTSRRQRRSLSHMVFQHETRYRILWTTTNLGCHSFPLMMDIACSNAHSIQYIGSSTHRHPASGTGSGTVECYPSLFQDKMLHCRRTIPHSGQAKKQPFYQEVLWVDIICSNMFRHEAHMMPTVVTVDVREAANIQCHQPPPDDDLHGFSTTPAVVGSALTVVPVTFSNNANNNNSAAFAMFPPPRPGVAATSVTCLRCQDGQPFYINYNNSIGNKVAQMATGCQSFGSCHDDTIELSHSSTAATTEKEQHHMGYYQVAPQGCINRIAASRLTFQDNAHFSSRVYPLPASSQQQQPTCQFALIPILIGLLLWLH
ncbi:expressed unknown protein [Seminavis robusta]|uniref:CUB domain-containing protein n=1 Tax=Seminavis robusta TaxID=568900 RepID=A0A9N8DF98_9STRA|nr:expressed unknown protein [Seminavis robusta]|eukprot:Sro97_g049850.1 n/a (724) ;mRNA; r:20655-22826